MQALQEPRPVAVITGAAAGIGWATAKTFAFRGWSVALLDLDASQVDARARELGESHLGLPCDVTDPLAVRATISEVIARRYRIDALINNAGIGDQAGSTLDQSVEVFDRVLSVHLRGSFLLSQAVLDCMRRQERDSRGCRGAIVNIGSIASFGGIPGRNAYSAAKAGILGMTRSMAVEWARQGIRVNAVAPGYVATALVMALASKKAVDTQAIAGRTPLGRLAEPDEIAEAIVFLASPAASYITGATLSVDGGWSSLGAPSATLEPLA